MKVPTYSISMSPEEIASWGFMPAQWMTDEDWAEWESATGQMRPANLAQASILPRGTKAVEKVPKLPED